MSALKSLVIDCFATFMDWFGISAFATHSRNKLLIITFHRVLPDEFKAQYPYPGLVVSPKELEWIIQTLKTRYRITTISKAVDLHQQESKQHAILDKPLLSITFDDGQLDNYRYAKPVLDKLQVKAAFYLPVSNIEQQELIWHDKIGFPLLKLFHANTRDDSTFHSLILGLSSNFNMRFEQRNVLDNAAALIDSIIEQAKTLSPQQRESLIDTLNEHTQFNADHWTELMTWDQIKMLHDEGHEIGSHTMSHALIDQLDDKALIHELCKSKEIIERQLASTVTSFVTPMAIIAHIASKQSQTQGTATPLPPNGDRTTAIQTH